MGELDAPLLVDFPLRGEWTVERTPADRIPSHGTDAFGLRYAYDFIRTDQRRGLHPHPSGTARWILVGGRTQDCYGWDQPVHAAAGGQVVEAVDGVPERRWIHPVVEALAALRNTVALVRGRLDLTRLAGNHVIVESKSVYALYGHLAPGSVTVTKGGAIPAGHVIGRVGHTGNSTAPHLHFQLMDRADALTARGIPCAFEAYQVLRGERWMLVKRGVPERLERIRPVPRVNEGA
ncbi:MAG TPA: M23 family metallopeptidase [Actinomycetota bacterium]